MTVTADKTALVALQVMGSTVLLLRPLNCFGRMCRYEVVNVGAAFKEKEIARPGDLVFLVELPAAALANAQPAAQSGKG
jgi:hypothetical protein